MTREIVLDTETTGMDPADGHRILEIGAIELHNHLPTGKQLHLYINPERDIPAEAIAVHGLTEEFLKDKPVFAEIVDEFLTFVDNAKLIIHNAAFDVKFINAELKTLGFPSLNKRLICDSLAMARRAFPGSPANLDALCRRFNIDNSSRTLHGALLDSELLAEVYLELIGGRQHGMQLNDDKNGSTGMDGGSRHNYNDRTPRILTANNDETAAHDAMLDKLTDAVWKAN